GELVSLGTTIFVVADLSKVYLTIYVSESMLGKVKLGQTADVSIDSYPGKVFNGKVIHISPEAEFTPKNIQTKDERLKLVYGVKIEIENTENILKVGMPADAMLKL
ncbi:MAG: HlyD family secretion protein, partial [Candidatus Poribacteria bacterium]